MPIAKSKPTASQTAKTASASKSSASRSPAPKPAPTKPAPKVAAAIPAPAPLGAKTAPAKTAGSRPTQTGAATKPAAQKPVKAKKPKLVRDSFTIPKAEYLVLEDLKQRAGVMASPVKKSELLRAGIKALAAMPDTAFLAALQAVPAIKTGRPTKEFKG